MVNHSPASSDANLRVDGPMTIGEVARWRDELGDMLACAGGIRLDLSASGPWDLSGMQLLLAVLASCEQRYQTLRLINPPSVFLNLAERSGLLDRFSPLLEVGTS